MIPSGSSVGFWREWKGEWQQGNSIWTRILFSKKLLTSAAGLASLCYSACSVILEMLGSLLFKVNASYMKMNPFKTTIILHMKLFSTGEPINLNKYILVLEIIVLYSQLKSTTDNKALQHVTHCCSDLISFSSCLASINQFSSLSLLSFLTLKSALHIASYPLPAEMQSLFGMLVALLLVALSNQTRTPTSCFLCLPASSPALSPSSLAPSSLRSLYYKFAHHS